MPFGTSDGQLYDNEFDYWHAQMFGQSQEQPEGESALYLVRHGDTNLNEKGSEQSKDQPIRGWSQIGLNDDGIDQAHKAADSLSDKEVTRVVSSDLPRAKQTANIIGKKLNVPVTFDPNLRTWDMGDYTGSTDPVHRESVNKYATEDQNSPPPGSSESFNQFKDRIINTMTGYAANNEGHKTVVVTHHSPERVFSAWEHAGYPDDNGIHMATYQEEGAKPGGHQEIDIPDTVFNQRFNGMPRSLPMVVPGETFDHNDIDNAGVYGTLRDDLVRPKFPGEGNSLIQNVPYNPDTDPSYLQNVMESPDEKFRREFGPGSGRGEGGGSISRRVSRVTEGVKKVFGGQSLDDVLAEPSLTPNQARGIERYVNIKGMLDKGMTFDQMAESIGINRNQVASIVSRLKGMTDIPKSPRTFSGDHSFKIPENFTSEDLIEAKKYLSYRDINKQTGVNINTLRDIIDEATGKRPFKAPMVKQERIPKTKVKGDPLLDILKSGLR